MIAIAAAHMGYRVTVLDPDPDCPAAQVADDHIASPYEDRDAARELGNRSDVVTYEFENVDAGAADAAGELAPVYPSSRVLRTAQDRILEKASLNAAGFPVTPYRRVGSAEEFQAAIGAIGLPAVLKTARMGYDGKGQAVIESEAGADDAFERLAGSGELVLERFVPFEKELSVICARDATRKHPAIPVRRECPRKRDTGPDDSPSPGEPGRRRKAAAELAAGIASHLDVVGLIAVEMFLTDDDRLLVNELAPRPHNSGHHTIEACRTSQYEQLVRALCGLPLGDTSMPQPAAMANLLGDVWIESGGQPDFAGALSLSGVSLHLYGKAEVRSGRKMGHLTAVANHVEQARSQVITARNIARRRAPDQHST